jgi:hypothetical protein
MHSYIGIATVSEANAYALLTLGFPTAPLPEAD